ncbi:hypothetical protein HPB49_010863 [Dermacentor silvarum]|uniref:Uncharacterized protein n=1 Tax=Dermacentor silvarum TaxID=543639 RepID=A0ACB8DZI6_DERSI|nr:hypothetical protein HPB49_010863 [Dermacentor silvarum]
MVETPRILLLDNATGALDVASETHLLRTLAKEDVELLSARKILQKARPDCSWFFLVSLASIVVGASLPVFAVFYSEIFNTFTLVGQDMQDTAFFWSMMFLVLAAARGLGHFFRTLGVGIAGENLTFRLRVLCWPTYCGNTWAGLMKTPIPLPNWPLG